MSEANIALIIRAKSEVGPAVLAIVDPFDPAGRPGDDVPVIAQLADLGDTGWHAWAEVPGAHILVRRLDERRYVGIRPLMFTWGLIWGYVDDAHGYEDRWCYHDLVTAVAAATVWDGTGDPAGWHRHPTSGRRRPEGDPTREFVAR